MSKKKSLFTEMAEAKGIPERDYPKRLTIREADNGFIVTNDSFMGPSKEHIYTSIDDIKKCLDEHFGGKAKKG